MSRVNYARNPSFEDRRSFPHSTRTSPPPPIRVTPFNSPYIKPGYALKSSHTQQPSLFSPRTETRSGSKYDLESGSFRHGKTSPSRSTATDLRRKMVFILHEEVKKSPSVIVLEEISDMGRITDLCMSTLRSMMESKRHRKYLYHMNNSALCRCSSTQTY